MVKSLISRFLIITLFLLGGFCFAKGVKVVTQGQDAESKTTDTMTMVFDQDNLQIESRQGKTHTIVVFNGLAGTMTIADMNRKTKMVMTEEKLQKMRGGIEQAMKMQNKMMNSPEVLDAMKQMRERMKDMSEEERRQAEKYIPNIDKMGVAGGETEEEAPFRLVGNETVERWKCRKYVRDIDGIREEVLATDFSELGLKENDFVVFNKIAKFFKNLGPEMGDRIGPMMDFSSEDAEARRGYPGVPVKSQEFKNGKLQNSSVLVSAGYTPITTDMFQLPGNLTEDDPFQQMEDAMPGMKR